MAILSIQSHVCFGHVGNAAAVFPLQRLGFEVWPVHCLQFSNHPGYGDMSGEIFDAARVGELLKGVERRGVFGSCRAVLTGYLGDALLEPALLECIAAVRQANPDTLYLCDPVMGDSDTGVYVRPGVPEFLRDRALPVADIITPNLFELGILAGKAVEDRDSAIAAARGLLNDEGNRLRAVVVTSVTGPSLAADATPGAAGEIGILAVSHDRVHLVTTPWLEFETPVKGTGDVLTALLLGHYLHNGGILERALVKSVSSLYAVISETRRRNSPELCLVAAQDAIAVPPPDPDIRIEEIAD